MNEYLESLVQKGLASGASFCESRFFEERRNSIVVENGIVRTLSSGLTRGVGVRVIQNNKWGFASTNIVTPKSIEETLMDAIGGAKSIGTQHGEGAEIACAKPSVDRVTHKVKVNPEDISPEEKTKRMLEIVMLGKAAWRSVITPPGVSSEKINFLRKTVSACLQNPDFLKKAQKVGFLVHPLTGEDAEASVEKTLKTSPEEAKQLKHLIFEKYL